VAAASAGPYAILHLATDRYHTSTPPLSFFTGWMPFLSPNQQRQSTEGNMDDEIEDYILEKHTYAHQFWGYLIG